MREKSRARLWRRRLRVPSELQRFDNAERVPCDIMRNGCEHGLRFTNLDDELYRLSSNYNLFHTLRLIHIATLIFFSKLGLILIPDIIYLKDNYFNIFEAVTRLYYIKIFNCAN